MSVVHIIHQVRKDHPGMGARTIWDQMKPPIGRDEFEYIALQEGLGVQRKRNYQKTTDSSGVKRFANLVTDIKFSISTVSATCPPIWSATKATFKPFLAE